MENVISFGKFDPTGHGRKINEITVEVELSIKQNGDKALSICGNMWNFRHTDLIACGQCYEYLDEFLNGNEKWEVIKRLWKLYHLNDLHAGTPEQERVLKDYKKNNNIESYIDYNQECEVLKNVGIYEVTLSDGTLYRYGSDWLCEQIPEDDLKIIEEVLKW